MAGRRESVDMSTPDDPSRRYSIVTKLVHYTSKFYDDGRSSSLQAPVRIQPPPPMSRAERRRSTLEIPDRFVSIQSKNFDHSFYDQYRYSVS
jgi:hypothetical protein